MSEFDRGAEPQSEYNMDGITPSRSEIDEICRQMATQKRHADDRFQQWLRAGKPRYVYPHPRAAIQADTTEGTIP